MRPLGKSQLAKIAGVSPAAVTKAIKKGRLVETEDGKVDQDHPLTIEYLSRSLQRQRKAAADDAAMPKPRAKGGGRKPAADVSDLVQREQILKLKDKEQVILTRKLKNAQMIGTLVLRDAVFRGVVNPIQTTFIRMLTDLSKTLAAQIVPLVKGGADEDEIEEFIRKGHSGLIKSLKKQLRQALDGWKSDAVSSSE